MRCSRRFPSLLGLVELETCIKITSNAVFHPVYIIRVMISLLTWGIGKHCAYMLPLSPDPSTKTNTAQPGN